ncbi:MAG: rhomboid family intramembrane serine protease [Bryobacteraceae bacterium]
MFPIRDTQPSYSKPVVTVFLIVVNILVFLFEFSLDDYTRNAFIGQYGLVPDRFAVANIFTSMFLHAGWLHVLGNMWFLWIFGDNVEDILGHGKFLLFYLLCGTAAGLAQVLMDPASGVPMVGASGAIAGVLGAYMVKFPRSRIVTLFVLIIFITRVDLPAWVYLFYWFVIQLAGGFESAAASQYGQGGTAFAAHVGGFVVGIALIFLLGTRPIYSRREDLRW